MADDQKNVLAALGVASVAEAAARLALLTRFEALTGKTGDEALGVMQAMAASHAELPKANARITELEKSTQDGALDALITQGKAEAKITPALEASIRAQVTAGDMTLKGAQAMVATLAPVPALGKKDAPPSTSEGPTGDLKHNGKSYDQLTFAERAELSKSNPDLYSAMRKSSNAAAGKR